MQVNTIKERISKGRAPTKISYNVGATTEFTQYELNNKKTIENPRSMAPEQPFGYVTTKGQYGKGTRDTQMKWYNDEYTHDNAVLLQKVLENNPFINNIINKSVDVNSREKITIDDKITQGKQKDIVYYI